MDAGSGLDKVDECVFVESQGGQGLGWLDRNGESPGRHLGDGPDRGAVEAF